MIFLGRICGLPPSEPVAQALLDAVRRGRALEQGVTLEDIVVAKASMTDRPSFGQTSQQALRRPPARRRQAIRGPLLVGTQSGCTTHQPVNDDNTLLCETQHTCVHWLGMIAALPTAQTQASLQHTALLPCPSPRPMHKARPLLLPLPSCLLTALPICHKMIMARLATLLPSQARLERMGEEDATSFCHQVLMSAAAKQALAKQPALAHSECTPLQHGLTACSRLVLGAPAPASLISAIASGAMAHARPDSSGSGGNGPGASAPVEFTVDVYRRWVKAWPAVQELLGSLLKGAGLLELQRVVEPGAGPGKPTNVIKPPTGISSVAARSQDRPPWMPACPALAEVGRPGQQPLLLKPLFAWMLSSCMTTGEAQTSGSRACRLHHFQSYVRCLGKEQLKRFGVCM